MMCHQHPPRPETLCLSMRGEWAAVISKYLAHIEHLGPAEVDAAEHWAANTSMFQSTASWRIKVIAGVPWLRLIRIHSHWAERTNVLRIVLLALARAGSLPDFEFVYAHSDVDPTPHPRPCRRHSSCPLRPPPLPLFTNARWTEHEGGLPLPDFTWLGWRESPPWCVCRNAKPEPRKLHSSLSPSPTLVCRCHIAAELSPEADRHPWGQRDERAFFSGGLDNGRARKSLRKLYHEDMAARDALLVRDVNAGKWFR